MYNLPSSSQSLPIAVLSFLSSLVKVPGTVSQCSFIFRAIFMSSICQPFEEEAGVWWLRIGAFKSDHFLAMQS